ncbi:MAG: SpoIIE family protein phosphatase [Chlorobi bacterium]|nr:SpoIIE family protein phosphatase [Chlorobiota bacterium]
MKSFYQILEQLGGSRSKFSLENRIFNIACITLSALALFATIINVILQVNIALTLLTTVSVIIFTLFFYFTRYKNKFNSVYIPFLLLINIFAGILWFLNGGTHGPIAFGYMLLVVIAVIIGKRRDQVFLVSLIIVMLFFLFFIEYNYPLSIIGYEDDKTRFFDYTSTLILFIFLTSIIVRALKKNYDEERKLTSISKKGLKNSLNYANKIQNALINSNELTTFFNDSFIISIPQNIVSGDFYWIKKVGRKKIVVVADSTGQGILGGILSIYGISILNEIISSVSEIEANIILNKFRNTLNETFHNNNLENSYGNLDVAICIFDENNQYLQHSGVGNPLYLIRENDIKRLDVDRLSKSFNGKTTAYSNTEIQLKNNDVIYLSTDGYINQPGGAEKKKFMSKQFKELLLSIHTLPMAEQKELLISKFDEWKTNENEQIDDVLIIGIKI